MQIPGRTPGEHGDDGGDARPALRRALPARARHVGAAGRRGLARRAVGQAARRRRASTSRSSARRCAASRSSTTARTTRSRIGGDGATGLGKPLKLMLRPLRAEIPIYLASIAPKSVELAFEIARRLDPALLLAGACARGLRADGARARRLRHRADACRRVLTDDVQAARDALKPYYALYIGGMGARGKNFYNSLFARYGYEDEAREIQDLFLDGKQRDAAAEGAGRVRRRRRARRAARADRRAARRVARVGRDLAARLGARREYAPRGGGGGGMTLCSISAARWRSSPAAAAGSAARWRTGSPRPAPSSCSARARSSAARRRRARDADARARAAVRRDATRSRSSAMVARVVARVRPRRHPRQQRRHRVGRRAGGHPARGLAEGRRREPHRRLPLRAGGRAAR